MISCDCNMLLCESFFVLILVLFLRMIAYIQYYLDVSIDVYYSVINFCFVGC